VGNENKTPRKIKNDSHRLKEPVQKIGASLKKRGGLEKWPLIERTERAEMGEECSNNAGKSERSSSRAQHRSNRGI